MKIRKSETRLDLRRLELISLNVKENTCMIIRTYICRLNLNFSGKVKNGTYVVWGFATRKESEVISSRCIQEQKCSRGFRLVYWFDTCFSYTKIDRHQGIKLVLWGKVNFTNENAKWFWLFGKHWNNHVSSKIIAPSLNSYFKALIDC